MNHHFGDVAVSLAGDSVAIVEIQRPPDNYFDVELVRCLVDAYEALDADSSCRAIVLCSEGKHFCAGARFAAPGDSSPGGGPGNPADLYMEAARLFKAKTPVIAAIQGAAIGGGLGLACSADFRVGSEKSRFSANFARLGFHHGFGLTVTLPMIVGQQHALDLLYSGRRISGVDAGGIGLCDKVVADVEGVRSAALELAREIAGSAPLAVRSIRETMRGGLFDQIRVATARELSEQNRLRETADWTEGISAAAERREPHFEGR